MSEQIESEVATLVPSGEELQLWNVLVDMILEWEDSSETAGDLARRLILMLRKRGKVGANAFGGEVA